MTNDEVRAAAILVRSKPTIANKYDNAANKLQQWALKRLDLDEKLDFESGRLEGIADGLEAQQLMPDAVRTLRRIATYLKKE